MIMSKIMILLLNEVGWGDGRWVMGDVEWAMGDVEWVMLMGEIEKIYKFFILLITIMISSF